MRMYADFNNSDEQSRVRLTTYGSKADIERYNIKLTPGMRLTLYMEDIEVEAAIIFDEQWLGVPDWANLRDLKK